MNKYRYNITVTDPRGAQAFRETGECSGFGVERNPGWVSPGGPATAIRLHQPEIDDPPKPVSDGEEHRPADGPSLAERERVNQEARADAWEGLAIKLLPGHPDDYMDHSDEQLCAELAQLFDAYGSADEKLVEANTRLEEVTAALEKAQAELLKLTHECEEERKRSDSLKKSSHEFAKVIAGEFVRELDSIREQQHPPRRRVVRRVLNLGLTALDGLTAWRGES